MPNIEKALLHAKRAEAPFELSERLREYVEFLKANPEIECAINDRYELLFDSGESIFPISAVALLPLPEKSEEKYPGFFNTVVFLLAAEHFERYLREGGFENADELLDTYYENARRFMEMNKVRDDTYALVRHGHYLYGYAKPFILRIGRLAYQLMQYDGSLLCPFSDSGRVRFALNPTAKLTDYGYPSEAGESRLWNEGILIGEDGAASCERAEIDEGDMLLKKGDFYITVHIPGDGRLLPELVKDSFKRAEPILKKAFREYSPKLFACASWLLSPQLKKIVDKDSNIRKFQDCFDIAAALPNTASLYEHIFKTPIKPISELEAQNEFQKRILGIYERGEELHMGFGILKKEIAKL